MICGLIKAQEYSPDLYWPEHEYLERYDSNVSDRRVLILQTSESRTEPPLQSWAHVLHDVPSGAARDPGRAPKQEAEGKNKVIVGVAGLGCALDVWKMHGR